MTKFDEFDFKSTDTQDGVLIYTPYDDDIPKEFRAKEPAPPPYDIDPQDTPAIDLLFWALDEIA